MLDTGPIRAEMEAATDAVLGILDYRYAPYALGDTFTWLVNLHVLAEESGRRHVDLALLTLPETPASRRLQPHITPYNYMTYVENLLPAFRCGSAVRSLRIFERNRKMAQRLLASWRARNPSWPRLGDHLRRRLNYSSHRRINAYHARRGALPRLRPPPGYGATAEAFRAGVLEGRPACVINIRQRHLTSDPSALDRDSSTGAWAGFLRVARRRWPDVVFLLVGGFGEWLRGFARLDNVVVPRLHGLGLGHELHLLLGGTPFMGTSSGFSAAATFSRTPYVITNFEHRAAEYIGLPVGTPRYPFALGPQILDWERETTEHLVELFSAFWPQTSEVTAEPVAS